MEDQNSLLLQRVAVLRRQLKEEKIVPQPDTLVGIIADLERALLKTHAENAELLRKRAAMSHGSEALELKYDLISRQNETLERQKQNLERLGKTLERHNTLLQRQNAQIERHNAELEEKIVSLEAERRRYQDLFEHAPDPYLITDNSGIIQDVNQAAAELLNFSAREIKGENLLTYVAPRDQKLFISLLTRVHRIQDIELCVQPRDRAPLDTALTLSTFYDDSGHPILLRWLLRDITERRRSMAALNASERRFRTIFNEATLGIVLLDGQHKIVRANRTLQEMLGYGEEELYNRPISDLTCAEDVQISQAALAINEIHPKSVNIENRLRRRDGQLIWTSTSLTALSNGSSHPQYLMAMIDNISADKQAASELAEMRRRLLESGEVERLRLAQVLHDGPMQDLYGAVFRLTNYSDQTTDPGMLTNLGEMQDMLKTVANALRTIVGELRPPTISNLGLERAIRSHAERLQEGHPELEIKLHLTRDGQTLPAHTRLAYFRIYQHCIENVIRHAQASQVVIDFHLDDGQVTLDIWDNGKGFSMPDKWVDLLREGHFGLASIQERAQALGGKLKIETRPGAGTLIHVTAPFEKNE